MAGKTTVTAPNGAKTVYSYDALGQLVDVLAAPVGGVSQRTQYTYDAKGNLTRTIDPMGLTVTVKLVVA
ncbi:hypothetical protein [Massilia sp. H6]|uniref:hypothetical protein n=1 Tax=Massilia sp. H6 TaxID=2970464 RepID=UPI0035A31AC2